MKINVSNTEKVQEELSRVQRNARVGLYAPASVQADAEEAERRLTVMGLTEVERRGARWTGYARSASSKKWMEDSTVITLERGVGNRWFLTHVARPKVHDRVRSAAYAPGVTADRVARRLGALEGVAFG